MTERLETMTEEQLLHKYHPSDEIQYSPVTTNNHRWKMLENGPFEKSVSHQSANDKEGIEMSVSHKDQSALFTPLLANEKDENSDAINLISDSCNTTEDGDDTNLTSSTAESVVPSFSFRRLNRQKKLILISVWIDDCLSSLCISLPIPLFPELASTKNVNVTISGWIFGVLALSQVILSPVIGKALPKLGIKFMCLAGLFLAGGCTILFGFITYIDTTDGPLIFIILCFLLRVVLAVGYTSIDTSGFTLVIKEFPDDIATVFGICEVFLGIGVTSGPAVGGVLFGLGGFVLPFAVIGSLLLLSVPINFWLLPTDDDATLAETVNNERKSSLWRLLQSFDTIVTCLVIVIVAMIWSVLDPTLEPHLRDFDLDPRILGLIFLLTSACYATSSPFWGYVADRLKDNRLLLIPGSIMLTVGLLLLGPSPLVGFGDGYNKLWLNIVALCVVGFFLSASLVPTFDSFIIIARKLGFEDDIDTYSMVAGLYGSMYALGDFIGPILGGWLFQMVGFQWLCTYIAGSCVFITLILSLN